MEQEDGKQHCQKEYCVPEMEQGMEMVEKEVALVMSGYMHIE